MQNERIDALEREVRELRSEIDRVDDWANGLFAVLTDVLPALLKANPELAARLAPKWRDAADRFDRADQAQPTGAGRDIETAEFLEARKMLYRLFDLLGAWPEQPRP